MLRPGGKLALTTIELSPDVPGAERRRAIGAGPRAVTSRRPYPALLESAGFAHVGQRDLTDEYLESMTAWKGGYLARRVELEAVEGPEVVAERLDVWTQALAAAERGWLRRTMYWAQRPA